MHQAAKHDIMRGVWGRAGLAKIGVLRDRDETTFRISIREGIPLREMSHGKQKRLHYWIVREGRNYGTELNLTPAMFSALRTLLTKMSDAEWSALQKH